jgi:hypothetical protein
MDVACITGSIRVDTATQKGSVIDVIRLVQQCNASDASTYFKRLINDLGTELGTRCPLLRINGRGQATPCADARTLVEIVWALPSKAAREFRRRSAQTVCRVLGGDLSLAAEIEAQHDSLQQEEGGRAAQGFLLNNGAQRSTSDLPLALQIATAAQKSAYFDFWLQERQQQLEERRLSVQQQMLQQEVAFVQSGYDLLAGLGVADARDKIACGDLVRRMLQQESHAQSSSSSSTALVPPDDLSVPTPECDPVHRGAEISMHSVAARLNLRIPSGKESQVGKAIKRMYAVKYGQAAASRIPKRDVPFRGQIFAENTYWQRDVELVEQAILEILK